MSNPNPNPSVETQFGGVRGNKPGRPRGTRDKINERTLKLIAEVQAAKGAKLARAALEKLRDEDPQAFWRLLSGLLPKQVDAEVEHKGRVTFIMERFDGV